MPARREFPLPQLVAIDDCTRKARHIVEDAAPDKRVYASEVMQRHHHHYCCGHFDPKGTSTLLHHSPALQHRIDQAQRLTNVSALPAVCVGQPVDQRVGNRLQHSFAEAQPNAAH